MMIFNMFCPFCKHEYKEHVNNYGKICIHCCEYIPPAKEMPIIVENRNKALLLKKQLLDYLKDYYANKHRKHS